MGLRSHPVVKRRPRIGPRASMVAHFVVMLLCAIAIRADSATNLAWILFWLNAFGAALAGVALLGGDQGE